MPRKKAVPPAEAPKAEIVSPVPEAKAPKTLSAPSAPPAAEAPAPATPESAPSDPPAAPGEAEETTAPEDTVSPEAADGSLETDAFSSDTEIPSDFVEPDGELSSLPEVPPAPEGFPAIVTAANGLNIREGPGFGFEVLGVAEFGTLLIAADLPHGVKVPGWEMVYAGKITGWVSDKHLRILVDETGND